VSSSELRFSDQLRVSQLTCKRKAPNVLDIWVAVGEKSLRLEVPELHGSSIATGGCSKLPKTIVMLLPNYLKP
jgi:hypothetical protein